MSEHLATASVLIVPDTTKFRALLAAELLGATGAANTLTAASRATTVSTRQLAVTATATAKAVTTEAAALNLAGAAAVREAKGSIVSAAEATRNARAHEQLARGAGATVLQLGGARGATLAASKSFLIGAAAVTILAKSVREAISEQEAAARVVRILGTELGKQSEEWAKNQVAVGLSATAALKAQGAIAEVLHNLNLTTPEVARLSQEFVQLAPDMAAFANVPVDVILRALQLGISGNLRSLRPFIGALRQADVTQLALTTSGKQLVSELTNQELALARIALIQQAASNQVGTFADRQGHLAAQTKILESELANFGATIGTVVIPVLTQLARDANILFGAIGKLGDALKKLSKIPLPGDKPDHTGILHRGLSKIVDVAKAGGPVLFGLDQAAKALDNALNLTGNDAKQTGLALDVMVTNFNQARGPIAFFTNSITAAGNAFDVAAAKFRQGLHLQVTITTNQADTASRNLLRLQAEGAPLSEQLTSAQKEIVAAQKALSAADALTAQGSSQTQKIVEDRLQRLKGARGDAESIQSQIDALSKSGAKAAAKAEKTAQQLLDEQDQRLQTEQGLAQGEVSITQARAKRTRSLVDDLAALKDQVRLLSTQIVQAAKIHDLTTRLQTIQQLTLERIQAALDVTALKEEQAQRKRDRAALLRDRADQRLELSIEIADTNKNVRAEIAARSARIRLDTERLKSVHGDLVRRKQLQLQIAQDTQAIKDLKKQQDKKGDAFRSLTFAFLQTQQGFAANLLSNLLPTGAASGTVGGRSAGVAPTGPAPVLGPGQALAGDSARSAAGAGGATQGQMAMLIKINEGILGAIVRLVGTQRHPEAQHQRVVASTDNAYGV